MSTAPKLSVIVPVFNPGAYLRACINSVLQQSYADWELILVDDGSTDGSASLCRAYAQADTRIRFISIPNSGVSVARNTGLENAHGEWIHFLDSDDYLELDAYAYLLQKQAACDADVIAMEHWVTRGDTESVHELDSACYGLFDNKRAVRLLLSCMPSAATKLFSRACIGDIRFTPGLARGEDTEFARCVMMRAARVLSDSRPLYHYVQTEESAVRGTFRADQLSMVDKLPEWIADLKTWDVESMRLQQVSGLHFLCSIYFDMYLDLLPWKAERRHVATMFRRLYQPNLLQQRFSACVKFLVFYILPALFCFLHVHLHKELRRKWRRKPSHKATP